MIKWSKFSGAAFTKDMRGFFYSRYDEPKAGSALRDTNYYQKLYYHKLGTPQSEDELIYKRDDHKEWGFGGAVTDDGHYLIVFISEGTDPRNRVYYKDLTKPASPVVPLMDKMDATYNFVDNDGPALLVRHQPGRHAQPPRRRWIFASPSRSTGRPDSRERREAGVRHAWWTTSSLPAT